MPGDRLAAIAEAVRAAAPGVRVELIGVTYLRGKAGVHCAYLRSGGALTAAVLTAALASPKLAAIHELVSVSPAFVSAVSPKAEAGAPAPAAANAGANVTPDAAPPPRLDLATLYTSRGLFTGTPRMPLPSTLDSHLYVPAGADPQRLNVEVLCAYKPGYR